MHRRLRFVIPFCFLLTASAQPPSVSQVLMWSTVTNTPVGGQFSQSPLFSSLGGVGSGTPVTGTLNNALFTIYTNTADKVDPNNLTPLNFVSHYSNGTFNALNTAISSSIAVALSVVPVASPASAVIQKKDPVTGGDLDANATLGPIFTQRAETIAKGKFYIGISHQSFHFTSFNGQSLNGITMLDTRSNRITPSVQTNQAIGGPAPATYRMATDIRLSQDIAFLTAGLTNRVELSLGLPVVHSAVAAGSYDARIYTGDGLGGLGPQKGSNCWCANTLSPGTFILFQNGLIGRQASLSKTGFGDILVRAKGEVLSTNNAVVTIGGDLRLPTGDADNYLGTGTTSAKPFLAVSLYKKTGSGFTFSPHFDAGWQFSGKSVLGGTLSGTPQTATLSNGDKFQYLGAPLVATKDYIPDVFAWSAGAEWALGNRNTIVTDILGNEIGWIHGAPQLRLGSASGFSPFGNYDAVTATGITPNLSANGALVRASYGQYNGSFGYKVLVAGKLVATFNALVRFDNNGLTSRFAPLFGLSYTF